MPMKPGPEPTTNNPHPNLPPRIKRHISRNDRRPNLASPRPHNRLQADPSRQRSGANATQNGSP